MNDWNRLNRRLDYMRIWIVGSDEWVEMLEAMWEAVVACMCIESYENAEKIIELMEEEVTHINEYDPNWETIQERKKQYKFGEFFPGDEESYLYRKVEPRWEITV